MNREVPSTKEKPPAQSSFFGKLLLFLILCSIIALPFSRVPGKLKRGLIDIIYAIKEKPEPEIKIVTAPPPALPESPPQAAIYHSKKLFNNGVHVKSTMDSSEGTTASQERGNLESYQVEFLFNLKIPQPSRTVDSLSLLNPHLPELLPDLADMLLEAEVSGFFYQLYKNKIARIGKSMERFNRTLSRHNFYDCETILELQHPVTQQKVLFIQSEMDVVSDGSDGDRQPVMDAKIINSDNYQAFTSYGWPKTTQNKNPLLARYENALSQAKHSLKNSELSTQKQQTLRTKITLLKRQVHDLKARSFLIAKADPFIVLPSFFFSYKNVNDYAPQPGDYAVVIHEKKMYPAIVGDAGPNFKIGEASLRIAKEISKKATPYNRPVSNLTISYLIFPRSAEKEKEAPDLEKWHQRCLDLIQNIGGLTEGNSLHTWESFWANPR